MSAAEGAVAAAPTRVQQSEMLARAFEVSGVAAKSAAQEAAVTRLQTGDYVGALKIRSGELIPHTKKDVEATLKENLSTNRNAKTKEKEDPTDPNEKRKHNNAKAKAEKMRDFIETGTPNDAVRDEVKNFLTYNQDTFKEIVKELAGTPTPDAGQIDGALEKIADQMLRQDGFRDELRTLFTKNLDPKKRLENEGEVQKLTIDREKLKAQLKDVVTPAEISSAETVLATATTELRRVDRQVVTLQAKEAELAQLTEHLPTAQATVRKLKFQVEQPIIELRQKQADLAALDSTSTTFDADQRRIQGEINGIAKKSDVSQYLSSDSLIQQQKSLIIEISTLRNRVAPQLDGYEKAKLKLEELKGKKDQNLTPQKKAEIQAQLDQLDINLANAKSLLEAEMIGFEKNIVQMPQQAAEKYINDRLKDIGGLYGEEAGKVHTAEEEVLGNAKDKLQHVWKSKEYDRKRGITFWKTDKRLVSQFMSAYLEGGADGLSASMISRITSPGATAGTFILDRGKMTRLGMSNAEIDALGKQWGVDAATGNLNADKLQAYFRSGAKELGTKTFADYLGAGGRLTRDIVRSISESTAGSELIASVKGNAAETKAALEAVVGKDVTSAMDNLKNSNKEFMKKNWWKIAIGILLLLGIIPLATSIKG